MGTSSDTGDGSPERKTRVTLRERLKHFTWAWFSCTMATGALASVLYSTPNRFRGLDTIGAIVYLVDVVLFVSFCVLIALRFTLVPQALMKSLHHPQESFFFGAFWVSLSLVIQNAAQYGTPHCGPWLQKALEVCFWVYAALIMMIAVFEYQYLFFKGRYQVDAMMPSWILPIYPMLVTGPLAVALLASQPKGPDLPIFFAGVLYQGLGWLVSMFLYAIWMIRLMAYQVPPTEMRPGMYIAVGPVGYTSVALVGLGSRAPSVIPDDFFGVTSIPVGDVIKIVGAMAGIFLWLLAFWFFCLTTVAVCRGWNGLSFKLTWWAFIFPNAGLTLAAMQIGTALDSPGIQGVTSAMTIALVGGWLFVGLSHVRAVWRGNILWPGKDDDKDMDV